MFASVDYQVTSKYQPREKSFAATRSAAIDETITIGGYKSKKVIGDEVQVFDQVSQSIINVGKVVEVVKEMGIVTRLKVKIIA